MNYIKPHIRGVFCFCDYYVVILQSNKEKAKMQYKFICRNCDEFLYIETVSEEHIKYSCSNCNADNVVSKEGH